MSMIHDITKQAGAHRREKRVGRGRGSGHGKTSGRGQKGSGARAGGPVRTGYIGGATEVFRRFPKRGFSNFLFEKKFYVVNLRELNRFDDGASVGPLALIDAGLVPNEKQPIKILGDGQLEKKLTVQAHFFSKSALEQIKAGGGNAQTPDGVAFETPRTKARKRDLIAEKANANRG